MKIERYAVYWVDFNPVLDRELSNTRPVVGVPAVVVSDDAMNATLETCIRAGHRGCEPTCRTTRVR